MLCPYILLLEISYEYASICVDCKVFFIFITLLEEHEQTVLFDLPSSINGIKECTGPYRIPANSPRPYEKAIAIPTLKIPANDRNACS